MVFLRRVKIKLNKIVTKLLTQRFWDLLTLVFKMFMSRSSGAIFLVGKNKSQLTRFLHQLRRFVASIMYF